MYVFNHTGVCINIYIYMVNFSDGTAACNEKPVSSVRLLGLALEYNSRRLWVGWAVYFSFGKGKNKPLMEK